MRLVDFSCLLLDAVQMAHQALNGKCVMLCIARSCGVGSVGDFLVLAGLAEWSSVSGSAGGSG